MDNSLTLEYLRETAGNLCTQNVNIIDSMAAILDRLDELKRTANIIDSKIDVVLAKLQGLQGEIQDIKNENRDIEQKLVIMTSKLSRFDESVSPEDIKDYIELAKTLYDNWDELDPLTQKFVPLAEYLYSKLQKFDNPDFSPVILELCRAIENEFLYKVFRKYTFALVEREGKDLDDFLAVDRAYNSKNTGVFVKSISKAGSGKEPFYALGQMSWILSLLMNNDAVKASPLLTDFKQYLESNSDTKKLLNEEYISNIKDIVFNFRNPSAHPKFMSVAKANECREIMPERIDYLVDCMRVH